MHDFDLTGELSLKIKQRILRPITEKVHSGNGPVSLVQTFWHENATEKVAFTLALSLLLKKERNFNQNTAIWTQRQL